jgi:hypothetical protein
MKTQGVDVNHQNNAGETALHAAAFRANNLGIQYLINEGGDMMKQTLNGDTPLHYGVMSDSFETVRLLLKHAPSEVLSAKNSDGRDPEELAKTLSATEFGGLFAGFKMKQKVANKVNIRIANLNAERTRLEIKSKVAEVEIDKEKGIREKISQTIKEMADTSVSVQKQLMDLTAELNNQRYDWSATRSDPTEFVGRQVHMLRVVSELLGNASSRLIPMATVSESNTNDSKPASAPKKQTVPTTSNAKPSTPSALKKATSSPGENRFSIVKPNAATLNKPRATIAMHKVGAANSKVGNIVQKFEETQSNTNQVVEPRKNSDSTQTTLDSPTSAVKTPNLVLSKSEAIIRKRTNRRDSTSLSQDDDTVLSRRLSRNKKRKKQSIDALDTFNMTEQIEAKLASSRKTHFDIIKPLRKSMLIEPSRHEVVTNRIITIQKIAHVVEHALSLSKMLKLHNSHMESISSMMKKEIAGNKKLLETLKKDSDLFAERIRAREELRILMTAFADPLDQLTSILINDQINQSNMSELDETIDDILQELTRKNNAFLKGVQKLHGLFTTEVSSFEYIFGARMSDIESESNQVKASAAVTKTESSSNLKVKVQRPSSGYTVPQIRVSSIDELIRDITGNRFDDLKVRDAFLLSYKNFLTSIELLYKLIERYCITPVEKDLSDDQLAEVRIEKQIPVRSRVLSLIKSWIEKYFVEFDNREFEHTFEEFIKGPVSEIEGEQYANALMSSFTTKKLERRAQVRKLNTIVGGTNLVAKTQLPALNVNEDPLTAFMALSAKDIVSQLTILGSDLFQAIKAEELFNQAWTKSDKAKTSPQVLALINHSNSVSSWLIRTILSLEQLDRRVEALKKVVQMAEECVSLNNFDTMVAIMAALDNASISRLRSAWKEIDKTQLAALDRLRKLNENNWNGLRQLMRSAPVPLIPFLGMYLTDLTYAEEGNPVFMNGKINFTRNIIVAGIINELLNYQRVAHTIAPAMPVLQYLDVQLSADPLSDNEAYAISMQYDQRQNTQKKLAKN